MLTLLWLVIGGLSVLLVSVHVIAWAVNRNRPDHQACLKRIYEMERAMPDLAGIPWVYRLEGLQHYLSWEEFPLEAYEPKKRVEPGVVLAPSNNLRQIISPIVGVPLEKDLVRHHIVMTESGNFIDKAYASPEMIEVKPGAPMPVIDTFSGKPRQDFVGFCVRHQTDFSSRHPGGPDCMIH